MPASPTVVVATTEAAPPPTSTVDSPTTSTARSSEATAGQPATSDTSTGFSNIPGPTAVAGNPIMSDGFSSPASASGLSGSSTSSSHTAVVTVGPPVANPGTSATQDSSSSNQLLAIAGSLALIGMTVFIVVAAVMNRRKTKERSVSLQPSTKTFSFVPSVNGYWDTSILSPSVDGDSASRKSLRLSAVSNYGGRQSALSGNGFANSHKAVAPPTNPHISVVISGPTPPPTVRPYPAPPSPALSFSSSVDFSSSGDSLNKLNHPESNAAGLQVKSGGAEGRPPSPRGKSASADFFHGSSASSAHSGLVRGPSNATVSTAGSSGWWWPFGIGAKTGNKQQSADSSHASSVILSPTSTRSCETTVPTKAATIMSPLTLLARFTSATVEMGEAPHSSSPSSSRWGTYSRECDGDPTGSSTDTGSFTDRGSMPPLRKNSWCTGGSDASSLASISLESGQRLSASSGRSTLTFADDDSITIPEWGKRAVEAGNMRNSAS
ncbi:hypothetical protein DFJ73DRAFT_854452 [Zopfochytrium polystomum]|nr:hypothetical protein DFJ73DRAFT_854452 [Zopfochytrium polystomum]